MEDKLRQRDAMTEKLRLKNATLKGQLQKVREYSYAYSYCNVEDRLRDFGGGNVLAYGILHAFGQRHPDAHCLLVSSSVF